MNSPDRPSVHGLYAITDARYGRGAAMQAQVQQALEGGASLIQYRDKGSDPALRRAEAAALLALCHRHRARLIINDDIDLALAVGADGVHLGRDDADLTHARERLGPTALIGVSCYNRPELAVAAAGAGADYVAFGRFFPSQTKPEALAATPALLAAARQALTLPIVAIGGITPDNGDLLIQHGADALAVIHGVFGQTDIRAAAARLAALFQLSQ